MNFPRITRTIRDSFLLTTLYRRIRGDCLAERRPLFVEMVDPKNGLGNATWLKSLLLSSKKLQPGLSVEKLAVKKSKKSCPTCYLMPRF